MRLTLRTLLAYLDEMLDPADAEKLRAKVNESEFAKLLTARLETVIKQPRISAPPLDGKGLGLDANNIAQYLDNTLAPERVPELEQFLLQSDMQLAEVGACHQILATLLETEPLVSNELRHRIRCLGSPLELVQAKRDKNEEKVSVVGTTSGSNAAINPLKESPSLSSDRAASQTSKAAATSSIPSLVDSVVISDPLRSAEQSWTRPLLAEEKVTTGSSAARWWRSLISIAMVASLIFAILQAIGPVNRLESLWQGKTELASEGSLSTELQTSAQSSSANTPSDSEDTSSPEPTSTTGEAQSTKLAAPTKNENDGVTKSVDSGASETTDAAMKPSAATSAADAASPAVATNNTTASDSNTSNLPLPAVAADQAPARAGIPVGSVQVASWQPPEGDIAGHLLFAVDTENRQLSRIAAPTTFVHGTQILVAPAAREDIQINHAINWKAYGVTDLRLTAVPNVTWISIANLIQGKAVLQDLPVTDFISKQPEVMLQNGNSLLRIRWVSENSAVAVEATPSWSNVSAATSANSTLQPGTDLRISTLQGNIEVTAYDLSAGDVGTVISQPSTSIKLTLGQGIARNGLGSWEAFQIENTPAWIESPAERPIDRQAAGDLAQLLPAGARANLVIREALQNRRAEVAALAAQTLVLADDYSFLAGPTGMLNDDRYRSHWQTLLEAVRVRIASSPLAAEALRNSLVSQDVQRGNLLNQTLVGYSAAELKLDGGEKLVNLLESEYLDERVLAIFQLKRLTGKDLGYQPDRPSRGIIQDWKRLWRSGGIIGE